MIDTGFINHAFNIAGKYLQLNTFLLKAIFYNYNLTNSRSLEETFYNDILLNIF